MGIEEKKMIKRVGIAAAVLLVSVVITLIALPAAADAADAKSDPRKETPQKAHFDPVIKDIEGWTVHVDPQMLEGQHAEAGGRALKMLANHLQRIAILRRRDRGVLLPQRLLPVRAGRAQAARSRAA